MTGAIEWDRQIGRRLRLRDLHVFFTVVQRGSMAKAAIQLGVSQPTVSEVIADLEHVLGVRLFDRSPRGVTCTMYGRALLKRGLIAFDELKQGIRDIEYLSDPRIGEVRIGCVESIASAILPPVIHKFYDEHPGVVLDVEQVATPTLEFPALRERRLDLVLARLARTPADEGVEDELDVEILCNDSIVVAAGACSPWAQRAELDIAELVDEPWILTTPGTWNHRIIAEAFRARGLDPPRIVARTFSVPLRTSLLATGKFITALPESVLRFNADRFQLKVLPLKLPVRPWPVAVVTLKGRTLSPIVQLFIDHIRNFTRSMDMQVPHGDGRHDHNQADHRVRPHQPAD